jgi:hypothetical protein
MLCYRSLLFRCTYFYFTFDGTGSPDGVSTSPMPVGLHLGRLVRRSVTLTIQPD